MFSELIALVGFAVRLLLLTIAAVVVISTLVRMITATRIERRILVVPYRAAIERVTDPLRRAAWPLHAYKNNLKAARNVEKARRTSGRPKLWVLDFEGDTAASGVDTLKDEITAVLNAASKDDEVMVRISSSGGTVVGYGLGASHLDRVRRAGLRLTAGVDRAAASGGYLMAAVADEIIAAPFAVIGSIGVVATIPNAKKLLDKQGVEILEFTAGEHKRTVTPYSEVTEERRAKVMEQLADIHVMFKAYVSERRPTLNIDAVATGEYWFGTRALDLGLVDQIMTSDQWLIEKTASHEVYLVRTMRPGAKMIKAMDKLRVFALEKVLGRTMPHAEPHDIARI